MQLQKRDHQDYTGLWRSEAQNHARTQKEILKSMPKPASKLNQIKQFLEVSIWGWVIHYFKSRFGKQYPFQAYAGANQDGIFQLAENDATGASKIVMAADWGSFTNESTNVGRLMTAENPDYSIHLGDTYFVGAPDEIESNFINPQGCWPRPPMGFLALPGNHEFYCNGKPYFETLLGETYIVQGGRQLKQTASFFCLENGYWRIIGLDTGYHSVGTPILEFIFRPDAHLDDKVIDWLKKAVKLGQDNRGIVLLTHHQYCSAFEKNFAKAGEAIYQLLPAGKKDIPIIWIWGHEHRLAIYGKYKSPKGIHAYGRCIGHGGAPPEVGKMKDGKASFKAPDDKYVKTAPLICYDNRQKSVIGKDVIGYNGYVVLTLKKEQLIIEYKDDAQSVLLMEEWAVDIKNGDVKGVSTAASLPRSGFYGSRTKDDAIK
jgi:hypothetical protein